MRTVMLPGGDRVPALGQGTWRMGERPAHVCENRGAADLLLSQDELAALDAAFPRRGAGRPIEML